MRILGLSLCLCVALVDSVLAQADAAPQSGAAASYEEIQDLIDSIQTRVDDMNKTARDTDAGMEFLSDQVEEAIRKLSSSQVENAALRQKTMGLSVEIESLATTRDKLGSEISSLTEGHNRIVEELEARVQELADLLSLERKTKTDLQQDLDVRAAALRATIGERDEIALLLRNTHKTLTSQEEAFALRLHEMKTLKRDIADLRVDRDALDARLAASAATLDETTAELKRVRTRDSLLETELTLTNTKADQLNRQLLQLREQIAELNQMLQSSESRNHEKQQVITNLGRRLNLALATKVKELARYRSEFFGRLSQVLGERPDIRIVGDRFVFQSELLFNTGEAELEAAGREQLLRLARSLKEIAATIPPDIDWVLRIDGHTDERPIQTARFPSNWELSTARAISVVRFLFNQGIPADRLVAAGFAEFQPLVVGRDDDAFRRNRRIEFRLTQK